QSGDHLVDRGELDARVPPGGRAVRDAALVQAARGILDEAHLASTLEETADRRVVADVGGDAEDGDLVRIEPRQQALGVRVREDVDALFHAREVAALKVERARGRR